MPTYALFALHKACNMHSRRVQRSFKNLHVTNETRNCRLQQQNVMTDSIRGFGDACQDCDSKSDKRLHKVGIFSRFSCRNRLGLQLVSECPAGR